MTRYKYTITAADGTIHEFKTLKAAKASYIGFHNGMRIISYVRLQSAAEKRSAAALLSAANQTEGAIA
jgi:hypothetical protein